MPDPAQKLFYKELVLLSALYLVFAWLTTLAVRNNIDFFSVWGLILSLALVFVFGSIIMGIYYFLKFLKEGKFLKKAFTFLTVIPILIILPIISGKKLHEQDINATIEDGNAIIGALEEYHYLKNRYPDNLSDLKPDYFAQIPMPKIGFEPEFIYHKQGTHEYWLGFYSTDFKLCEYKKNSDEWECKE